jgi:hypothetical protein
MCTLHVPLPLDALPTGGGAVDARREVRSVRPDMR